MCPFTGEAHQFVVRQKGARYLMSDAVPPCPHRHGWARSGAGQKARRRLSKSVINWVWGICVLDVIRRRRFGDLKKAKAARLPQRSVASSPLTSRSGFRVR